jgi:collagen type III alpha
MPAVAEKKAASKPEEFVEKQIEQARHRIRTLDFFAAGLFLAVGTLVYLLAVLLVDRYVELPRGAGWAAGALYALGAAGYLYWALFRPSRRHINPFYAARKVEQTIPDAKNSVINYVDLKDDESVPGSVKAAIGTKAARDLKQVDLHQAIQRKQVLWLAVAAGLLGVGALVAAFLPPTRTSMTLLSPAEGDVTVKQGEDVRIEVELRGRIPEKNAPDAARVRLWYNPEDPGTYEERPLEPVEGEKRKFGLTIPAKQVRNGFFYRVSAGKVATRDFEVKVRIVPQFMNWEVQYEFPDHVGREPEKTGDPNLVGYYGTKVTITAHANRPIRSGVLEVEGQTEAVTGQLVDGVSEAIRFRFDLHRGGGYRVRFVTTEGAANENPQRFRITLLDPRPMFLNYDVTYDYPKYLRYDPSTVTVNVREPHLEAMLGTKVTLLAHANRVVKSARVQFPGVEQPIAGLPVEGKPTQVKFVLPPLTKDGAYRVVFTPQTDEKDRDPRVFTIKVLTDEKPRVEITKPEQEEVEIPANGTLGVEGIATDDIGLAKMNLRLEVISPGRPVPLAPKPYREGKSFERESDHSFPSRIDYKDFAELAKLRPEGQAGAGFKVEQGMVIEYWLEALDNCDVPPGPNVGLSNKKRVRVLAPVTAEQQRKKEQERRDQIEKDKKQHDQQQDQKNEAEKREAKKPQPKGDPQPQQEQQGGMGDPQPQDGKDRKQDPNNKNNMGGDMPPMGGMPDDDNNPDDQKVKKALKNADPMGEPKEPKNGDPMSGEPKNGEPKNGEPKNGMDQDADPKKLPNPEDFQKLAEKLDSTDEKEREKAREQLKKMMEQSKKEPPKAGEAEKKIDEQRNKLNEEEQKKFDEAMQKLQKEMQNLNREDKVKQAAEKAASDDEKERAEGQKELENLMKNPKTRNDVERQLQGLAGGESSGERKRRLDDALDLSRKNLDKKEPPSKDKTTPKDKDTTKEEPKGMEELPTPPQKRENVDELAKKASGGKTEQEKQEAKDKLEEMLKDPKTREQTEKQLDDIKNDIKDEKAKKDFENQVQDLKDKAAGRPTADQMRKTAEKLNSKDPEERKEAQKQLEEAMKQAGNDPKARERQQKALEQARENIKGEKQKVEFDRALKEAGDAAEKQIKEQEAKRQEKANEVAKGLNDKDEARREAAQKKLEEMLKEPGAKERLDKAKEGLDQAGKENLDKAVKQAEQNLAKKDTKKDPGTGDGPKKEDVEQLAKDLNGSDAGKREAAQKKLEELMRDPKNRDAVKDQLDKAKKDMDQTGQQKIDDAVKKAEDVARKGGEGDNAPPKKEEIEKLAGDLKGKDAAKQKAAQDKLEQMLKDPKNQQAVKDELKKLQQGMNEADKKNLDDAVKKAEENLAKKDGPAGKVSPEDVAKAADKLRNGSPQEKQQAREQLEKMLWDPKTRAQVEKQLEQMKAEMKDGPAKDEFEKALADAKKNAAGKDGKKGEAPPKLTREDVDKLVKQLGSKDQKDVEAARKKLDEIMKDPKEAKELDRLAREMAKDPEKQKELQKATQKLVKDELNKLADKLQNGTPKEKQEAKQQLEDLMKNPLDREVIKQNLGEIAKDIKDDAARRELEKQIKDLEEKLAKKEADEAGKQGEVGKHDGKKAGGNSTEEAQPGSVADLKNKVKAGELTLERFKKNITNEEFQKQLGWTKEQIEAYERKKAQQLADLKAKLAAAERGDLPPPREKGPSLIDRGGPEKVSLDGKDGNNPLQGGKFTPPPGFGDPYKRFTEEVSGLRPAAEPAKK